MGQGIDTIAVNARYDLRELARSYTTLRRHAGAELCGPCPKCGGRDRFYVAPSYFACRTCHTKRGDAIEFVQWMQGVKFKEAVEVLDSRALPQQPVERKTPATPAQVAPAAGWTERATALMAAFVKALWAGSNPGADYLLGRGLDPGTWETFKLGFAADAMGAGPAIALPWYRAGALWGIRYRLLSPPPGRDKLIAEKGSTFRGLLFGGQALPLPSDSDLLAQRTLVIVEGEINAMSVWQTIHAARVDVLSLGSESAHLTDGAVTVARRYRACLVWMDKESKAREYAAKVNGGAYWSEVGAKKSDANDLLRDGKLGVLLAGLVKRITPPQHAEALRWDLWTAANEVHADEGLRKAVTG